VADQSLARSALEKLAGIESQLTEFYGAVVASKQLKQKLTDCHSKAEIEYKQLLQEYGKAFTNAGKRLEELYKNQIADIKEEPESIDENYAQNLIEEVIKEDKDYPEEPVDKEESSGDYEGKYEGSTQQLIDEA